MTSFRFAVCSGFSDRLLAVETVAFGPKTVYRFDMEDRGDFNALNTGAATQALTTGCVVSRGTSQSSDYITSCGRRQQEETSAALCFSHDRDNGPEFRDNRGDNLFRSTPCGPYTYTVGEVAERLKAAVC
jgi:hypothetical protein